tara:strand:+ start:126 stop:1007 length:882 start_codon:yes stop_codon:yes gene_type:complete
MNRKDCLKIVRAIDDIDAIKRELVQCINTSTENANKRGTWQFYAKKLLTYIESDFSGNPPFSIYILKGNKKLPFAAFSSLALADCPGKGDCAKFCYSLTAWRYPAAFFRQLQNSLLMRFNPEKIESEFLSLPSNITLRLFVDGDFMNVKTLRLFMDLCKARSDLKVYGYSKSWREFLQLNATGYKWPSNYLTNASSGSRHANTGLQNAFLKLPVVRGSFNAVKVNKKHITTRAYQDKSNAGSREYRKEVTQKLKLLQRKSFACPGNCGNCLPKGRHACGSKDFAGVAIGIGIH